MANGEKTSRTVALLGSVLRFLSKLVKIWPPQSK